MVGHDTREVAAQSVRWRLCWAAETQGEQWESLVDGANRQCGLRRDRVIMMARFFTPKPTQPKLLPLPWFSVVAHWM